MNNTTNQTDEGTPSFFGGLIIGGLLGAAVALLFAKSLLGCVSRLSHSSGTAWSGSSNQKPHVSAGFAVCDYHPSA